MAKILIVEDDGIIAMNTMSELLSMGHEILGIAKSSGTAFAKIEAKLPELILMDIVLHGDLSGVDITRIINEKYDILVVYATAHTDDETLRKVNSTRHAGILYKPFERYQLREAIDAALGA